MRLALRNRLVARELDVIHVMTVHYRSDRWIPVQLRYLRRNVPAPFRLYAFLVDVPPRWQQEFDFVRDDDLGRGEPSDHAIKLNALAAHVCERASDDDVLVFLDGDAFPIRDPLPFIREHLIAHGLIAVRRDENLGDVQPHPLFCAVTAGLWRRLPGDWRPGPAWSNARGDQVTDVGGCLLEALERQRVRWLPLRRSNTVEFHRIWFGLYGGLIYHHGAAFRKPLSRLDLAVVAEGLDPVGRLLRRAFLLRRRLSGTHQGPSAVLNAEQWLRSAWPPYAFAVQQQIDENQRLSTLLMRLIEADAHFYDVLEGGMDRAAAEAGASSLDQSRPGD